MQVCENCHIRIRGHKAVCPLCEGQLTGTPEDPAFPVLKKRRYTSREVMKAALFIFFVSEIIMGTIRYLGGQRAAWATVVMLWAPLALAGMFITMAYRYHVLKLINAEFYIAMILNILIDRATGSHSWAVSFVVPSLFLALVITNFVIAFFMKYRPSEYLTYALTAEALSFLQIILIVNGVNRYPTLTVIFLAVMLIFVFAELIFLYQDMRNATARTLHL